MGYCLCYLDDKESSKISEWIKERRKDGRPEGCIGGRFTYKITHTTLGTVVIVVDNITKEELDISNYEDW